MAPPEVQISQNFQQANGPAHQTTYHVAPAPNAGQTGFYQTGAYMMHSAKSASHKAAPQERRQA